jgi:hypothetical protein
MFHSLGQSFSHPPCVVNVIVKNSHHESAETDYWVLKEIRHISVKTRCPFWIHQFWISLLHHHGLACPKTMVTKLWYYSEADASARSTTTVKSRQQSDSHQRQAAIHGNTDDDVVCAPHDASDYQSRVRNITIQPSVGQLAKFDSPTLRLPSRW